MCRTINSFKTAGNVVEQVVVKSFVIIRRAHKHLRGSSVDLGVRSSFVSFFVAQLTGIRPELFSQSICPPRCNSSPMISRSSSPKQARWRGVLPDFSFALMSSQRLPQARSRRRPDGLGNLPKGRIKDIQELKLVSSYCMWAFVIWLR